ncbi:hypothetical protein K8S19_01915, partial [bacterium]|nr:hypothetical protein [bacterium]
QMRSQARNDAIAWSNGIIVNEDAFRILQRDNPREAARVRYHEQFSNDFIGMLVLLPGVQRFLERRMVNRFNRKAEPLRVDAQIQPYVWGRPASDSFIIRFLRRALDKSQMDMNIAELWFGAHKKNPGIVRMGNLPMDLDKFAARTGERLLGTGRKVIGQLFKVLDAKEPLSIQMHERFKPDSKNESWMVVIDRARLFEEGKDQLVAEIYLGFRPIEDIDDAVLPGFRDAYLAKPDAASKAAFYRDQYAAALEQGKTDTEGAAIKAFNNKIEVRWESGDVEVYINGRKQPADVKKQLGVDNDMLVMNVPGATVHALSYGVIYELQETADKTLRLYDQGRNDPNRPLHIAEAVGKLDFTPRPAMDYLVAPAEMGARTTNLIRTPLYSMDQIMMNRLGNEDAAEQVRVVVGTSYQMLMVAEGRGELSYTLPGEKTERYLEIRQGDTLIVPAQMEGYTLKNDLGSNLAVLKAYESTDAEIAEMQTRRGGKNFWEEDGFFVPETTQAEVRGEVQADETVQEMRRMQEILPSPLNKPLRGFRYLPLRMLQYGVRSMLFANDRSMSGNLNSRAPLRAVAGILLAGLVVLQSVVAVFAGARGQAPVVVDDLSPRFAAIKRTLVIPDAVMAKQFNIKQIRFRSLSEQGSFIQRLLSGKLLGAYTENYEASNHGEWATIFVPDQLLRTMNQSMPAADGTLRTGIARLRYRANTFLFGAIVGYQADKYYFQSRYD